MLGVFRDILVEEHVQVSALVPVNLLHLEQQASHSDFPVLGLFHNLRDGHIAGVACGIIPKNKMDGETVNTRHLQTE